MQKIKFMQVRVKVIGEVWEGKYMLQLSAPKWSVNKYVTYHFQYIIHNR